MFILHHCILTGVFSFDLHVIPVIFSKTFNLLCYCSGFMNISEFININSKMASTVNLASYSKLVTEMFTSLFNVARMILFPFSLLSANHLLTVHI